MDKTVRIYHLRGTHSPYVLSRDGLRDTNATRQDTTAGHFYAIREMFDELRAKGLYDSSLIILTADHGSNHFAEYPCLLIKEPFNSEPYRENHSAVSLFDLAIYLSEFAGTKLSNQQYGEPIQSIQENSERVRHFFRSATKNNKQVTIEYITSGFAGDKDSLIEAQTYYDTKGADTPYYLGTILDFTADATGNRYIVDGKWSCTDWRTYLLSDRGKMQFPIANLPKDGNLHLWFDVNNYADGLDFSISANGKVVYENRTGKELVSSDIDFTFPVSYIENDRLLILDFQFKNVTKELLSDKKVKASGLISFKYMAIDKQK